jgi:AcrR family transcriptional regulator
VAERAEPLEGLPHRARLSRDRVVRAAVALADQGGIESLSMRNLAEGLGVVPMALYKHVANKEELVDGMVDVVFGEADFSTRGDWKPAMRQRAISMRQALVRHPWAIGRMESGVPGPANLRHHNATMGCLRETGFSFPMAVHAYSLMDSYIYGFALQEKNLPADIQAEAETRVKHVEEQHPSPADDYPYLMDVAEELAKSGYDYTLEFEFGLDLILDGIERLRRQELASTTSQGKSARKP